MGYNNNEHLNIFHHYSQNGSIPIENNISRGLAIVFQEYPTFLLMFLNKIGSQIDEHKEAITIDGEYYVNFQKRVSDFSCPDNIVGVSLTAKKGLGETWDNTQNRETTDDPITDISIEFNDTIIIIEVKRTDEDCNGQLKEQISKIIDDNTNVINAHFTWTDIIEMLETYHSIASKEDRIIDDYYHHICYCFPQWCPVKNLANISDFDINAQEKRLNVLINEYNKNHSLPLKDYIDISNKFDSVSELHVWIAEKNNNSSVVKFGIWPSATKSQYWEFLNKSTCNFLNEGVNKQINNMDTSNCVYVRIYDTHGRPKYSISTFGITSKEKYTQFCEKIIGRWGRNNSKSSWDEFYNIIMNSSYVSTENRQNFKEYFEKNLMPSNMNFFNAILSCEIISELSYKEAQNIDKNGAFDKFITDYICNMKSIVEDIH